MQSNIQSPNLKYKTPETEGLKSRVEDKLRQRFGDSIVSSTIDYDYPCFEVKREAIIDILEFLYNDSELEFRFLTTLCGLHYPHNKDRELGVMYQLHNMPQGWRIRLKTFFPSADPKVRTATTLFRTANWLERQEYDFFGIIFEGHPNLRRILNMEEMNYHPMLKQYAVEDGQREDKDNSYFGR